MRADTAINHSSNSSRRYDRDFKTNAVALVQSGRTITEVARDLGGSTWPLRHRLEQAKAGQAQNEPKTLGVESPEQLMRALASQHSQADLAAALGVSVSGFHDHEHKPQALRRRQDAQLKPLVIESFERSRRNYGSPRIRLDLANLGQRCGKNRIARLRREQSLRRRQGRFRLRTADSRHGHHTAQNWLAKMPALRGPSRPRRSQR